MLAAFWFLLASAILVGAGYSHYRYRVKNNLYYDKLYSQNLEEREKATLPNFSRYALLAVAIAILFVLVPILLTL
ncbi:hypothetical protein [Noviherbaspirillum aerium]|uniref:hypothetical protein n=1 Tax=Noviherbaspirillum aerium TaxID=2588497 RepID=UPI00124BF3F6|nr:hypothetical protein [Noviherbaspirillum aerium]